jgi:hypothetical protein
MKLVVIPPVWLVGCKDNFYFLFCGLDEGSRILDNLKGGIGGWILIFGDETFVALILVPA